jgi:predicted acylesterase/phospholipase RssA
MEHIVISSAGPYGLIQLGMIAQLMENNYFTLDTIQSIHGTSAGSILAVLLCLRIPIPDVIEYFIKRPLHKWFKLDITQFMKLKGMVSSDCFSELLAPLFYAQEISLDITMKELYELSSIDLHLYTTAVTKVEAVDLNHVTFPDLPVLQAIAMSSSIPLLFTPIEYQNEYYVDGGLLTHCPLPPNEKTIVLCIKITSTLQLDTPFQFLNHILVQSFRRLSIESNMGHRYEYSTLVHALDPTLWEKILIDESFRSQLIQTGREHINK